MENDTLNKIDEIIKRTNTDYGTAKEALEAANGDVLEAIILIENQQKGSTGSFRGEQIMAQLKDILAKGNATKLTIKKDNEAVSYTHLDTEMKETLKDIRSMKKM